MWSFLAVAALALVLRAPVADIPLERDEGEYAYIAQRWLIGEAPYKESFDQKPPGVFAAYAVILRLAGESPTAIHWGAQVYTLGTLALIAALGRKLFSPEAGLAAAACAAFLTVDSSVLGNAANTEVFMILPLAGALLATCRAIERDAPGASVLAGAASAAAILFKQVALPSLAFCVLLLFWRSQRRIRHVLAFAAGICACLVPVLAYFLVSGAWSEFIDCVVGHNLKYAGSMPLANYPANFWAAMRAILATSWAIYLLAAVGLVVLLRSGRQDPGRRAACVILVGWTAAALVGVAMGGYFRPHYFIQAVPGIALLAGAGVAALAGRQPAGGLRRRLPHLATAAAVLIGVAATPWYFAPGSPTEKSRRIYGGNPFPESQVAGAFIGQHTAPEDRVFVLGSEPQILFYAARKSATRYIFVYPLMTTFPGTRERQREALEEIAHSRPKMIVTVMNPETFLASETTPEDLVLGVVTMIDRDYHIAAVAPLVRKIDRTEWLTGEAARQVFEHRPPPAKTPYWCSLAVWERNGP